MAILYRHQCVKCVSLIAENPLPMVIHWLIVRFGNMSNYVVFIQNRFQVMEITQKFNVNR